MILGTTASHVFFPVQLIPYFDHLLHIIEIAADNDFYDMASSRTTYHLPISFVAKQYVPAGCFPFDEAVDITCYLISPF